MLKTPLLLIGLISALPISALSISALADSSDAATTCTNEELNRQKEVTVNGDPRTALCLQQLGKETPVWVLMDDQHPVYINKRALKAKGDDIVEEIESKTQQILQSENVQQLLEGYKDLLEELLKESEEEVDRPQTI